MTALWLRYDLRGGGIAVPTERLYAAAIEQTAWADRQGFDRVMLGEHHGSADGYVPSPMLLGAALAARSSCIRFHVCTVMPLHDPLRVAEDVVVLDQISGGRVELSAAIGYVPFEFAMFGVPMRERAERVEAAIRTLRSAFSGEIFEYRGRQVRITPRPVQGAGPPILVGGAVKASAARAARLGDGFIPSVADPALVRHYREECARLGRPIGPVTTFHGSGFIHVTEDPERDWMRLAPHLLHELNAYSRWAREGGAKTLFPQDVTDIETLKASGAYLVLTPDECLAHLRAEKAAGRDVMFNPLCGGLDPDLAWESLELLAARVLPAFRHAGVTRSHSGG